MSFRQKKYFITPICWPVNCIKLEINAKNIYRNIFTDIRKFFIVQNYTVCNVKLTVSDIFLNVLSDYGAGYFLLEQQIFLQRLLRRVLV